MAILCSRLSQVALNDSIMVIFKSSLAAAIGIELMTWKALNCGTP
jgi:hypothetical protein